MRIDDFIRECRENGMICPKTDTVCMIREDGCLKRCEEVHNKHNIVRSRD